MRRWMSPSSTSKAATSLVEKIRTIFRNSSTASAGEKEVEEEKKEKKKEKK